MGARPFPRPGEDTLYTDDDLDDLFGVIEDEESRCSGCGQPKHESFDPAWQDDWEATALRCHACAARGRAQGDFGANDSHGLYFTLNRSGVHPS